MQFLPIGLAVLLATQAPAGGPQAPAGSIEGVVIKMTSGEPVAGAKVTLDIAPAGPGGSALSCAIQSVPGPALCDPKTVITGTDGKFLLTGVAPGSYRLFATHTGGYVPAEYGQRSATGPGIPLEVMNGQQATGIQLVMASTASISGRIYDRDGEPLGRAQVQALRSVYRNGHPRMTIVQSVEPMIAANTGCSGWRPAGIPCLHHRKEGNNALLQFIHSCIDRHLSTTSVKRGIIPHPSTNRAY